LNRFRDPAELELDGPRKRIVVIAAHAGPGSAGDPGAESLLALLERIFPVRFEWVDGPDAPAADAALVLGLERLPQAPAGIPRLVLPAGARSQGEDTVVAIADDEQLALPLRGRAIADSASAAKMPLPSAADRVLASVGCRPVWWQLGASTASGAGTGSTANAEADENRARQWYSVYPLAELGEHETLREHLKAGRFMALLPLVHFLRQVAGEEGWTLPPPRAAFVVDDPNLHWRSYGFLDYRELIAHAGRHHYHLGLATVPLDRWWVDRRAAALVRDNGSALSLLMHGNDHVAQELGRLRGDREAESAMAQALRRTAALERQSGVSVSRVMVPPHSACSEEALRAMFVLGIEAVCLNRSYPWRDEQPAPTPLCEWHPAELVAGGMPMLLRSPLVDPREDLAFRALLGQPLILYGHHWDFAEGLDILAQAAKDVNDLGDVRWGPLGWIARGSFATRRVGETMFVRMCSRRIEIELPPGVRELRVLAQQPLGGAAWRRVSDGSGVVDMAFADGRGVSEPLTVAAPGRIELTLIPARPLDPAAVASPGSRPWSLVRRMMVEGRDRAQALR
jgi:hypothetical protein